METAHHSATTRTEHLLGRTRILLAVFIIGLVLRAIDCAFGVGGAALLWPCRLAIRELEERGTGRWRGTAGRE